MSLKVEKGVDVMPRNVSIASKRGHRVNGWCAPEAMRMVLRRGGIF